LQTLIQGQTNMLKYKMRHFETFCYKMGHNVTFYKKLITQQISASQPITAIHDVQKRIFSQGGRFDKVITYRPFKD